jgi:hypothetical protein
MLVVNLFPKKTIKMTQQNVYLMLVGSLIRAQLAQLLALASRLL